MRRLIPAFLLLLASCAQVLTPDGGEKDSRPPKVVDYTPDSATTNFTGKKIVIRFDEYVQLSDLGNQLIISPPMNEQPDVTIRKKDIVIDFNDTLLPNTTYTISFGSAIKDITEGNTLDNFRYVFSTGPVIDSLEIRGRVVNASTLQGEKGVLVLLYKATGDSVPLQQKPYYFAKTKNDGTFLFTNLKAGKYKAFALEDKNANYIFDNTEERVGFPAGLVTLAGNMDSLDFKLFREGPKKQARLKAAQPSAGRLQLSYALPMKAPQVTYVPALPEGMDVFTETSPAGDTINLWINNITVDSLTLVVKDSAAFADTVTYALIKPGGKKVRQGTEDARKLQLKPNAGGGLFDLEKKLVITSNNPLRTFNPNSFVLLRGKDTIRTELTLSENKRFLSFGYTFEEDSSYSLFIHPGAVTDWFGQKNDTVKVNFRVQQSRYYGTLNVKLTGLTAGNYILRLVNEQDVPLRETKISGAGTSTFPLLPPGQYRLKLITDANNNGKWDPGDYLAAIQPERVSYYGGPVRMRSGWDMDVEWIFK